MTPLTIACGIIGGIIFGAGLGLVVLLIMNRRELKRRARQAKADRLPIVEHWPL